MYIVLIGLDFRIAFFFLYKDAMPEIYTGLFKIYYDIVVK